MTYADWHWIPISNYFSGFHFISAGSMNRCYRLQELSVRKVLGASVPGLMQCCPATYKAGGYLLLNRHTGGLVGQE